MDSAVIAHLLETRILPPGDVNSNVQLALRSLHLVAGIAWIGLLYFFNLVGFPVMQKFDLPTRGKVIPALLPPALWWFRWGAVVTVLAGFLFWVLILHTEPPDDPGSYLLRTLGLWFLLVVVAFGIQMGLLRVPFLVKNAPAFVVVDVLVVLLLLGHFLVQWVSYAGASNRTLSIAVGGGIGLLLLLNVWGIVWRAQKRLIAWVKENPGEPPPPDLAGRIRQAYLVSRASFWLSFPMLFFMAAASHYPLFSSG
ncbi:MAG: urate hydroxylase PuuD [Terriglobia bacterium]